MEWWTRMPTALRIVIVVAIALVAIALLDQVQTQA